MTIPQPHIDPTFTPLRGPDGSFVNIKAPYIQVKRDKSDPDHREINPEIIRLCQRNGMARSCLILFEKGEITWLQCLETMVVALGKELLANQAVLVDQRNDYLRVAKALKATADQLALPEESAHDNFFITDERPS